MPNGRRGMKLLLTEFVVMKENLVIALPQQQFSMLERVYKVSDNNPDDWQDYVVLGINWACSRLKDGVPNDGYWEYEVSKPTAVVYRVQLAEDWLTNIEGWQKEKLRWQQEQEEIELSRVA
jgi:hypothetical protein